jgi:glucosamine kinase
VTNLVIGIDGGQTSTKCALATTEGELLAVGTGGPLVHFAVEGGRQRFLDALRGAVDEAWANAGTAAQSVEAAGLGLTGVEAESPEAEIVHELLPQIIPAKRIEVHNDAVAALFGAHLGRAGIVVIAGTGSIVLGVDDYGRTARIGGWGWLVGDEGSAAMIGRIAVTAIFRAFDGTGPPTSMEALIRQHFAISKTRDLKRIVYASDFGARGFAALAPVVSEAARQHDRVARDIINRAGRDLAHAVNSLIPKLTFANGSIPVAPVGGAFQFIDGLRQSFTDSLQPNIHMIDPALPPVFGAVILALRRCDVPLSEAIPRLLSSTANYR